MTRDPRPDWTADRLSQCRVADYKPFVMVDGEGVRCSLYVSGCPFACDGCFNRAAWSFRYGTPYDDDLADRIATDLRHSAVQGLSLLGGEPFLNTQVCLDVVPHDLVLGDGRTSNCHFAQEVRDDSAR